LLISAGLIFKDVNILLKQTSRPRIYTTFYLEKNMCAKGFFEEKFKKCQRPDEVTRFGGRPSCLIKAYIRPEKYCFVWAGPLANHPINFNLIFLSDGLTAATEKAACYADLDRLFRSDGRT
jgi:hypothetical protein